MRAGYLIAFCAATILAATQASAQPRGSKDCGNGFYCPPGNACLVGGLCAREIDRVAGSTRTSTGQYCDPGLREHTYKKGECVVASNIDCPDFSCAPGYRCPAAGEAGCQGPSPTGPVCGASRCVEGRICNSNGLCMNPKYQQDCHNGTVCSIHAACEYPRGCVAVAPGRSKQIRRP